MSGDVSKEVAITPAMIEAGVSAYLACDRGFDPAETVVEAIFYAMAQVQLEQPPEASRDHQLAPVSQWWWT